MIRLAPSPSRWIGLSTDVKPIAGQTSLTGDVILAADVTVGSTFLETDTNAMSTWNGAAWIRQSIADDSLLQETRAIGVELFRIRRLLEEANGLTSDDLIS